MANERESVSWENAATLEQWVEKSLRAGDTESVAALIQCLPEDKREKYREIWRRVAAEKKPK